MRIVVMLLALMPLVSFAKCNTPVDCYKQAIEDLRYARAEIKMARDEVKKVKEDAEKKIKDLTVSMEKTDAKITALLEKLDGSAGKVTQLADAVSVSEYGTIGIGKTSSTARLDVGGRIMADIVSFGHHTMKIETVIKNGKVQEDLTIPLGAFKNGNAYQIQVYIAGGWAEAGGIYHIVGDWGYLPTMNLRSESTKLQERLKFHAKMNGEGWYWLTATWDNISPDREPWVNDVYFVITGVNFDTKNTTEFTNFTELSTPTLAINRMLGNVGIGTSNPQYKLHVAGKIQGELVSPSDERLKQNIQPLASSLAKLAQLRGVSFKWKDEPQDNQIGLVAQEVEKILPEIVSTDSEGYKSIAYGKLTAVLLEAIKEQQQQIDELNKRLEQK